MRGGSAAPWWADCRFETQNVSANQRRHLLPFSHKLTANFWLGEFALNRPERRFLHDHQVATALELATYLEQVRARFGGPVIITSGHRPPAINRAVGGDPVSEHLYREPRWGAVDFYIPGAPMLAVEQWVANTWTESVGLGVRRHGFIHLGMGWGRARGLTRWNY